MPLLFKKRFFDAIRSGAKTQTIRWWRRPMARPGTLAAVPFLAGGRLLIDSVEPLAGLDELTDADAASDGFPSRSAMLAALGAIYPELANGSSAGRRLYRVRFHFVPRARA